MLRAVRLKNFIKFKEDQLLKFDDDGVYLFVGENSSGKSSVFEAVRRCMDMSVNCTFSTNPLDQNKNAYVVCKFSLSESPCMIFTSFVYTEHGYAKVVVKTGSGESKDEVCMDLIIKRDQSSPAKNVQCEINEEEKDPLITNLKETILSTTKEPVDTFLNYVATIIKRQNEILAETAMVSSEGEKYARTATQEILEALSEQVICTFGLRSVGGMQWSKSPNIREGEENYPAATDRCHLIKWFTEKENVGIYDRLKTQKIFKTLTCGETFDFSFKNQNGQRVPIVRNGGGQEFSILQIPEGILEAYHISLLLSCNTFQTLLLEEPDRGMHPQMIQKLKSIILPAEYNKIIVIISHNSAFLSSTFVPRTFKFYKFRERVANASEEHRIVKIGDAIGTQGEKMPRLVSDERYANVLFARRVFLVEGDSDIIFTRALFSHILNPEKKDSTKRIFDLVSNLQEDLHEIRFSSEDLDKLKDLLTSLYIMKLGGEGEKNRWHTFCENTMTPRLLLLDADAVLEVSTNLTETDLAKCIGVIHEKIVRELENDDAYGGKKVDEIAKCLKKRILKEENKKDCLKILPEAKWTELDGRYEKIYIKEIKEFTKVSPLTSRPLEILPEGDRGVFKTKVTVTDWDKARMLLRNHDIFVWKYGSIEDVFLDLILISDDKYNVLTRSQKFSSLNIDLQVHNFRKKPPKKNKKKRKLYINEKINDKDITNSIDLVIELCNKDSDIVHFIHFLTKYATKEYFPISTNQINGANL